MVKIAVCEDESFFREQLGDLVTEYFEAREKTYAIDYFQSGEELLEANLSEYHVFYLDIEIKGGMNGLETAKKIRTQMAQGDIVFVTNHQEEAYRAFEVNALRFLLKPIQKDILFKTMDLVVRRKEEKARRIVILNKGQRYLQVPYDNILYFETVERKLKVHTTKKTYLVDNKINELDKLLCERNFFRVHKSYLVNLAFVQEHDQSTVTMLNGDVVYISRLKLKQFKESFVVYLRKEHKLGVS
ncbi:LytR/AlgR family response regulator transcription factor [Anaeromicropila populeti]|uniref:Stage 0 sporulation protein A homolog n=1 Tax=Anaeromicropila populeti TaxID=37658 RepID=A0A1I6J1H6_9FIRM|nr:LytTR family DNA-binding domain-containing protein [Anaeromicropila populeti]SFR72788.1 two component transcriptional regulator, LytTR family [Anaeromicropila populeti]